MRMRLDELVTLFFLGFLLVVGVVTRSPLLEPFGQGRLTYFTLVGLPLVLIVVLLRRRSGGVGAFVAAWWPVIGVLAVYESLKHLHANRITIWLGITPRDSLMLELDELLFGKALPLWLDHWSNSAFISVMWFFYIGVYYAGPLLLLGYVYLRGELAVFQRLRLALVLGLLGGYVLYILVPVAGPLFHIGDRFTVPISTHPVLQNLMFNTLRYQWDCFPSLHTAIPWLLTFGAWPWLRRPYRVACVVAAVGVTLSTVALRLHYGIDLIAGVAWAGVVHGSVGFLSRRVPALVDEGARMKRPRRAGPLRRRAHTLAILFTVTGAVGLIAEQAFEKLLSTLVGASTPASALVLSAYFLGFTLGSAFYGRWIRRHVRNPLRFYGWIEGAIAAWIIVLAVSLTALVPMFAPIMASVSEHVWLLNLARLGVAAIWILPPTILMGISFPAIVDALEMLRMPRRGRSVASFYSFNLLGAISGAVLAPYLFFPALGLDGTLLLCAAFGAMVCFTAYRLSHAGSARFKPAGAEPVRPPAEGGARIGSVALVTAVFSGFLFFSLEVVWTHLLSVVIGNSVYAFATMLTIVLLGLGLGGALVALLFPGEKILPASITGFLLLAGSLALSFTHGLWPATPHALAMSRDAATTFFGAELLRFRHAAVVVFPAATIFGMVFPSLFRQRGLAENLTGRGIGMVYAANSIGCIAGALVTGFVILPTIGSEQTIRSIALCAAIVGWVQLVLSWRVHNRLVVSVAAIVVLLPFRLFPWDPLQLTSGEHVYFGRSSVLPDSRLLYFHEDTLGGITTVVDNHFVADGARRTYRTLLTNGKFQGNDSWEMQAQEGFALVPMMYLHRFEDALVIGAGTGHTAHMVRNFSFRNIDVAEIAPGMIEGARTYFRRTNGGSLDASNVRILLEDGRNVLLLRDRTYDLITIEISSVWFAGSTNLYSKEFYELARRRLKPGGVVQQWIQLHHIGTGEVKTVIATMREVFPFVSFWVIGGQGIVVGTMSPQRITGEFASRFASAERSREVELDDVLSSRLLSPADVSRMVEAEWLPINTDRNRLLEYRTPRYNMSWLDHRRINIAELSRFADFERPELEVPDLPILGQSAARSNARQHFLTILQGSQP